MNGNWTWRIGPLTSSNLNLSRTRSGSGASALETTQTVVRASLTRQFAPKFSGAVSLRRNQLDSSQAASYRENALTATAQMSF
ncbi:MAG: hypothetical protein IT514_13965 [Burkholderiales bacterium]|nr:hypothetical protein [Burkholderiales bacterium]